MSAPESPKRPQQTPAFNISPLDRLNIEKGVKTAVWNEVVEITCAKLNQTVQIGPVHSPSTTVLEPLKARGLQNQQSPIALPVQLSASFTRSQACPAMSSFEPPVHQPQPSLAVPAVSSHCAPSFSLSPSRLFADRSGSAHPNTNNYQTTESHVTMVASQSPSALFSAAPTSCRSDSHSSAKKRSHHQAPGLVEDDDAADDADRELELFTSSSSSSSCSRSHSARSGKSSRNSSRQSVHHTHASQPVINHAASWDVDFGVGNGLPVAMSAPSMTLPHSSSRTDALLSSSSTSAKANLSSSESGSSIFYDEAEKDELSGSHAHELNFLVNRFHFKEKPKEFMPYIS